MQLHPIMYVPDQYVEREFYELFGFERQYEGDEFPGFLALRRAQASFGLQKASAAHPRYVSGLRWQFELDRVEDVDAIIAICVSQGIAYEVLTEEGGDAFRSRSVTVRSPGGVVVWFEGPNEKAA